MVKNITERHCCMKELAIQCIPLDALHDKANSIQSSDTPLPGFEDALAEALVKWFKNDFFKWSDPIKCPVCDGKTKLQEMGTPTAEERQGGAGRVEIHICDEGTHCPGVFRFARYK